MYKTHGAYKRNPMLYNIWKTMIHRCENKKREKFPMYGGRGITVCKEWHNPNVFMDWAESNGYRHGLYIDRIDNDAPYKPSNCRWVSAKINSRNTRRNKYITLYGETKTVAEWCETIKISQYTIYWWIRKFGVEECVKRIYERLNKTPDEAIAAWNRRA